MDSRKPRILLFDLETTPMVGYSWGKYEQTIIKFTQYSQLLCFAWKWFEQKETYCIGQVDDKKYKPGRLNDKWLTQELWELLDKADVVVAHNGARFDVKVANARFLYHGMKPPSAYAVVDTKREAKKVGMFPSNKLAELSPFLGGKDKMDTGGFGLWEGCMAGESKSWKKMMAYNKQDVRVLEDLYVKLRPWMTNHPNWNVFLNTPINCPSCGGARLQKRGFRYTRTNTRQAYQCQECGAWSAGAPIKSKAIFR